MSSVMTLGRHNTRSLRVAAHNFGIKNGVVSDEHAAYDSETNGTRPRTTTVILRRLRDRKKNEKEISIIYTHLYGKNAAGPFQSIAQ